MSFFYYNKAAIPSTPPHETPDVELILNGSIFKSGLGSDHKKPLFARWTTDFDCGVDTGWWYTIKDTALDISSYNWKKRQNINRGLKNFEVKEIKATDYLKEMFDVQVASFTAYPAKYRPKANYNVFCKEVNGWNGTVFGAFYKGKDVPEKVGLLCGYCYLSNNKNCLNYVVHKTMPEFEKHRVNYALVYAMLTHFEKELSEEGYYVSNGQRSTNHETAFNDLLIRDFGFRKAYCRLHLAYSPIMKLAVRLLYPFRKLLQKLNAIGFIHKINAVLFMEEISRSSSQKSL